MMLFKFIVHCVYIACCWDSTFSTVTRLWACQLGFESSQGQDLYLFSKMTRTGPERTQHPMQWVLKALLGLKLLGREVIAHLHVMPRLRMS